MFHGRRFRRLRQVIQGYLIVFQPLAIGVLGGQAVFQFFVADDPALLQADQEHPARL